MQRQHQQVLVGVEPKQQCPCQRCPRQIERTGRLLLEPRQCAPVAIAEIPGRKHLGDQLDRGGRIDHLQRDAATADESRSERLVARDHAREGGSEAVYIKRPAQMHRPCNVLICGTRTQILEKPHTFLRSRRGEHVAIPGWTHGIGARHRTGDPRDRSLV